MYFLSKVIRSLVTPKSKNEDEAGREYILNILLLCCFGVGLAASSVNTFFAIIEGEAYDGVSPILVFAVTLIFIALYLLSRAGKPKFVASIFLLASVLPIYFTLYRWGFHVPQALLLYGLSIVMTGVLLGSKAAFLLVIAHALFLIPLSYLQGAKLISYDVSWKEDLPGLSDGIAATATLGAIAVVSWLSNREIERSLKRARWSEAALKKERDLLEVKVEERTRELKQAQLEKMLQLYRFAKFGRLASGLFHDLANPLTNVHLNLERLSTQETSSLLKRALSGVKQMENFVEAARKQIQEQEIETSFSAPDEIRQAIQMFAHRAKEERVEIRFQRADSLKIYGNPLKFYQLVTNLLSNAVDAYKKIERDKRKRQVLIELKKVNGKIRLTVQDWGCGIPKEQLGKIFDPFFTTKPIEKGIGIGLCICKDTVEKDFGGRIKVKSREGKGSTFTAEFPIKQSER